MVELRRILPLCPRLRKNCEGVTAVEFAMIAPAFLLLLFGTLEFSTVMYVQGIMESATFNAARIGKTGYTETGISREQTIRNMINTRAGMLIDINHVTITNKSYEQFDKVGQIEPYQDANGNGIRDSGESYSDVNGNGQWDADMGKSSLGNANDVVVYTISYPWNIMTPIINQYLGSNGVYTMTTKTVVKNEPY